MYIIIIISLVALLFTYLETRGVFRNGMRWGFILITIIAAIHYDYGNDYMPYLQTYNAITNNANSLHDVLTGDYYRDIGWAVMNYYFQYLGGFFMLVAILNIIQNAIVFRFIKKEVPAERRVLAVFIYLFTTTFFLMSFSMMRQMFVVCVFLGMWTYIKEKKWWIPLVVLFVCTFIHGSATILLPFSFAGFLPIQKANKIIATIFAAFIVALWVSNTWVEQFLGQVMILTETESFFERYSESDYDKGGFGLGAFIQMLPLVLGEFYLFSKSSKVSRERSLLVVLSLLGFATTPLISFIPLIGRMGIYFSIFQIASIPIIYGNIKNVFIRFTLLSLFILITIYDYVIFFNSPVWQENYSVYSTIFSVL